MDPLTAASAFATIVGLMGQFRSERKSDSEGSLENFRAWLGEHNFAGIAAQLEKDAGLVAGVGSLLQEDSAVLRGQLEQLDQMLASLAAHLDGFAQIASALRPEAQLSDQAMSILRQMEAREARAVRVSWVHNSPHPRLIVSGSMLEYSEPRFIDDDLEKMVELGLLRAGTSDDVYIFTRAASEFLNASRRKRC